MSTIFAGQTALRIQLTTGQDITDAEATKIKYEKPDGTTGEWSASVSDETTGVIYKDMASTDDLNAAGWWKFWAFVTFSDGRSAAGEAVRVKVEEAG
jgi:hypothetical protein